MQLIKVSSKSNPNYVAGAIAAVIREEGTCEIQAIGAGALNQAVKSVAVARGYVASNGIDIVCIPGFVEVEIDGVTKTAMKIIVETR